MDQQKSRKRRISRTSAMHYLKLCFRSILFVYATIIYIVNRINAGSMFGGYENRPVILGLIWLVFVVEMILRFFPSNLESMGCQKQFPQNYCPTGSGKYQGKIQSVKLPYSVAGVWILLNAAIGVLYFTHIVDDGIMLLISLAFSVCDMVCILFFCPFQTWFMKNKCCTSCRIYNWDYAMMFTPLIFVKSVYTWSILAVALALLVKWEVIAHRHPERFTELTNKRLSCAECNEKLCHHKKQLQQFLKQNKHLVHLKSNILFRHDKNDPSE